MVNRIFASSCAAAMLSISVAAAQSNVQTPSQVPVQGNQQGTRTQAPTGAAARAAQPITVVGCVQREGDARAAGSAGRSDTATSTSSEFVLANAMPGGVAGGLGGSPTGPASPGATGTSGSGSAGVAGNTGAGASTAPRSSSSGTGTTYRLTGDKEKELAQYVGQRVEIVATMTPGSASGAASPTGTSGLGSSSRPGDPTAPPSAAGDPAPRGDAADAGAGGRDRSGVPGATRPGTASGSTTSSPSDAAAAANMPRVEIVSYRALGGTCQ